MATTLAEEEGVMMVAIAKASPKYQRAIMEGLALGLPLFRLESQGTPDGIGRRGLEPRGRLPNGKGGAGDGQDKGRGRGGTSATHLRQAGKQKAGKPRRSLRQARGPADTNCCWISGQTVGTWQ